MYSQEYESGSQQSHHRVLLVNGVGNTRDEPYSTCPVERLARAPCFVELAIVDFTELGQDLALVVSSHLEHRRQVFEDHNLLVEVVQEARVCRATVSRCQRLGSER